MKATNVMAYLQSKIDAFTEARKKDGKSADEFLNECRGEALELSWQDIARIEDALSHTSRLTKEGLLRNKEDFYKEVLKRFKEE